MFTAIASSKNNNFSLKLVKLISIASVALLLFACESKPDGEKAPNKTQTKELQPTTTSSDLADATPSNLKTHLTNRYLSLASEQFQTICTNTEQLQVSVQLFLSNPNEKVLKKAKQHWLSTHNSYAASKQFRTLNIKHPVLDHSQIDPVKHSSAIRIDQSPLLPGYLDAIKGYPQSGYIFSPIPINKETLNKEHQFSDTLYVTLGFHAIEFLLWGEGNELTRKSTDYAALTGNKENTELVKSRRSQLLSLTTKLLTEDLQTQCKEWLTAEGYYPSQLSALPEKKQNEYIIATMEQLLPDIQINSAQIKNATEPHSAFAHSDEQDLQAQIKLFKSLLESKEWKELSKKQERAKKITKSAKALLQ